MSVFTMKLPDIGEGLAEAEIVQWLVNVGDAVTPETVLAEVLTDKATVEVSSPVAGTVVALVGDPGDVVAVGSDFVRIDTGASAPAPVPPAPTPERSAPPAAPNAQDLTGGSAEEPAQPAPARESAAGADRARPLAAPAVRARAAALGIDLATVSGTGPDGIVTHADLDARLVGSGAGAARPTAERSDAPAVEPVRGVRRQIAQRLSSTWSEIPHITYVDAVDVTELEHLRGELNRDSTAGERLTLLPFVVRAVAVALRDHPRLNAHYDHAAETLSVFDAVHMGIATQTDDGLLVPVVRHAEARGLRDLAAEIGRVTNAARSGRAARNELSGSTITITSLGALGGLATTPLLNAPEVAIVGVNKMEVRPVWRHGSFEPRQMMNLSSSFDHRMVDGWNAAAFISRVKALLETPALMFMDEG